MIDMTNLLIIVSNFALFLVTAVLAFYSFREAHRHTEKIASLDHNEVMALIKVIKDCENEDKCSCEKK